MRFLTRSLVGTALFCLTLGLLALAGGTLFRAMTQEAGESGRGGARERVYAANVDTLAPVQATPVVTAYGEVTSARSLEVRSAVGGRIVELSDDFRAGGRVEAGEVLVRLDPARAETRLSIAETELAEAEADLAEAEAARDLALDELAAAEAQRALRARALDRQEDLVARGAGTAAAAEAAELALSAAEQALLGRRQAVAQAEAALDRARIMVERRRISRDEARRDLADTEIAAPFDGRVSAVSAVLGGLVTANEQLGTVIDPDALELVFRVSNAEFARLAAGGLEGRRVTARLPVADAPLAVEGRIDRAGAEAGGGQTGRTLYAGIETAAALRPGDFVVIEVPEPPLDDVAVVPARAVNAAGEMLVLGPEDRLEVARVEILRRQGDAVIVGGAPFGRDYVTELLPQLGAGVKVRPVRPPEPAAEETSTLDLDAARRARLQAAVEADPTLAPARRAAILGRLEAGPVPAALVARIEARIAGSGAASETLALDAARRARLIAFVESNPRLRPDDKERILGQLNAEEVPRAMVERLERRMGG